MNKEQIEYWKLIKNVFKYFARQLRSVKTLQMYSINIRRQKKYISQENIFKISKIDISAEEIHIKYI